MSTDSGEADREEWRSRATAAGIPRHAAMRLGVDGEGGEHFWSFARQTAFVLEADGEVNTERVGDRPLLDWIAYVHEKRGWQELRGNLRRSLRERGGVEQPLQGGRR